MLVVQTGRPNQVASVGDWPFRLLVALLLTGLPLGGKSQETAPAGDYRRLLEERAETIEGDAGNAQPLCGVYATVRALRLLGQERSPEEFVGREFVSSPEGSSPADLVRVVERAGATATPLMFLSRLETGLLGWPVVANVRSTPSAPVHDHWVCVYPDAGGLVAFDGPYEGSHVAAADLLAVWNGYGIVVSPAGTNPEFAIWMVRISAMVIVLVPALVLLVVFRRTGGRARSGAGQIAVIVAVTGLVAVLGNLLFGDLRHHRSGIRHAVAAWFPKSWATTDLEGLRRMARDEGVLLIDARYRRDFETGSIPNAINIPHDISRFNLEQLFQGIPRDRPILVFCQSAACHFSDVLAEKLDLIGCRNVTVARAGLNELWEAKMRERQQQSKESGS